VNVAVADLAVEVVVAERCAAGIVQLGDQVAVGGVGRRVRQRDAGQWIQVAQAAAGQLKAQVKSAEVERVGQGASQGDVGVSDLDLGL